MPSGSPLEQLAGHAARLQVEWAERLKGETGIDTGYRRSGTLHLADDAITAPVRRSDGERLRVEPALHGALALRQLDLGARVVGATVANRRVACHRPVPPRLEPRDAAHFPAAQRVPEPYGDRALKQPASNVVGLDAEQAIERARQVQAKYWQV